MPQGFGQVGLAHDDRSHEEHVFVPVEEAEAEQVADAIPIEGVRRVPVSLERARLGEPGFVEPELEPLLLAPIDLVLEHELKEVGIIELGLAGVGQPLGQGVQDRREPQALEHGLE